MGTARLKARPDTNLSFQRYGMKSSEVAVFVVTG